MTKDFLQQKRFQAQSNGTTYVYDIPDMFRQMTERHWKEFSKARPTVDIRIPEKILVECVELVLDGDNLIEMQRLPGENNVSGVSYLNKNFKKSMRTRYDNLFYFCIVWNGSMANYFGNSRISRRS